MSDNNTAKYLRDIISRHFDEEELRTLCNDLGIDYDNLRGSGKANKTRELIGYYERRGRLDELVEAVRRERPNALSLSNGQQVQDATSSSGFSRQSKETFPAKVIAFSSVAGVCFGINIASGSILLKFINTDTVGYLWLLSAVFSILLFVAIIFIIGSLVNRGKGLFSFGVPIWIMKAGVPSLTMIGLSGIASGTVAGGTALALYPASFTTNPVVQRTNTVASLPTMTVERTTQGTQNILNTSTPSSLPTSLSSSVASISPIPLPSSTPAITSTVVSSQNTNTGTVPIKVQKNTSVRNIIFGTDSVDLLSDGRMRWHVYLFNKSNDNCGLRLFKDRTYLTDSNGRRYTVIASGQDDVVGALEAGVRQDYWFEFEQPKEAITSFKVVMGLDPGGGPLGLCSIGLSPFDTPWPPANP